MLLSFICGMSVGAHVSGGGGGRVEGWKGGSWW